MYKIRVYEKAEKYFFAAQDHDLTTNWFLKMCLKSDMSDVACYRIEPLSQILCETTNPTRPVFFMSQCQIILASTDWSGTKYKTKKISYFSDSGCHQ